MSKENEWEDDPDMQEFLEWADQPGPWDEEDDKIHTVGGLTNDKKNGFMSFVNKTKMSKIDFKNVIFVARPDTWYDEGTIAILDSKLDTLGLLEEYSAYFVGMVEGSLDGEVCGLDEFDWIDINTRECLNSNVPCIGGIRILPGYIVEDASTGKKYDLLKNVEIENQNKDE